MSVERITVLLEQLQDTINEQNRVVLLELEPSQDELDGLLELAASCRDSAQALKSPSMSAEYTRLLRQMSEIVDIQGLELAPETPRLEKARDGKRVRFSEVQEEFEPERLPEWLPEPQLEPNPNQDPRLDTEARYRDDPNGQLDKNGANTVSATAQYELNQNLMMEQDLRLESLSHSVGRTRQMGTEINRELDTQLDILDDLEAQTDRTQSRLGGATRRVESFNRKAREGGSCMIITVLVLILFILLVVL